MEEILLEVDGDLSSDCQSQFGASDAVSVFGKYVCEESGLMRGSSLAPALKDAGIDDELSGNVAVTCVFDDDKIPFEQFDKMVSLCTLREHEFPNEQLEAMFGRMQTTPGVIDLHKIGWTERQRLERFLRSHGVSLEVLKLKNKISLSCLQRRIAQELDDKRKADWLQETGVVKAIAASMPREVLQAAKGRTFEGRDGDIADDVVTRLQSIGELIEAKAREALVAEEAVRMQRGAWHSFNDRSTSEANAVRGSPTQTVHSPLPNWHDLERSRSPKRGVQMLSEFRSKHSGSLPHFAGSASSGSTNESSATGTISAKSSFTLQPRSVHTTHRRRTIAGLLPELQSTLLKTASNGSRRKASDEPAGPAGLTPRQASFEEPRTSLRASKGKEGFGRWLSEHAWSGTGSGGTEPEQQQQQQQQQALRWWEQYRHFRSEDVEYDDEEPPSCRDRRWFSGSWLSYEMKGLYRAVSWQLLAVTLLVLLATLGSGWALLRYWASRSEADKRAEAVNEGRALSWFIQTDLDQVLNGLVMFSTLYARTTTTMAALESAAASFEKDPARPHTHWLVEPAPSAAAVEEFEEALGSVMGLLHPDVAQSMVGLTVAPRGVASLQWGEHEEELGFDFLSDQSVRTAASSSQLAMLMPRFARDAHGRQVDERVLMHIVLPVFVDMHGGVSGHQHNVTEEGGELWGVVVLNLELSELVCERRLKQPLSAFAHDHPESGSSRMLEEELVFKLLSYNKTLASPRSVDDGFVLLQTEGEVPAKRVVVPVHLHLAHGWTAQWEWEFVIAWKHGFSPWWELPAVASVVGLSVLVAVIVLGFLISRKQHTQLLYRIMPPRVVTRLKQGRQVAEIFDNATIFFSDLVGFTDMSTRTSPLEVVMILNDLYTALDKIAAKHRVFKVDTIGDAYMVIGGAPDRCSGDEAAARVARFALDALEAVEGAGSGMQMRCGMASGSVVGAVLGTAMPKYSFFGDTVNTASRMESSGKPGRLQVTQQTMELLSLFADEFSIAERAGRMGLLVKGKGRLNTFWVGRKSGSDSQIMPSPLGLRYSRRSVASAELSFSSHPLDASNYYLRAKQRLSCELGAQEAVLDEANEGDHEVELGFNRERSCEGPAPIG